MFKKRIIVDSSVIVKWINTQEEKNIDRADKILHDAQEEKIEIYTSELAKYEVGNALLKGKQLQLPQAYASLGTVYALPITFVSETEDLANESYKIGQDLKITYYDASFLSLSKKYKATLITDNIRHQGKLSGIKVVPLSKYK